MEAGDLGEMRRQPEGDEPHYLILSIALGKYHTVDPTPAHVNGDYASFYPSLELTTDVNDPADCDIVVNATPMGAQDDDPMPVDVDRIAPGAWVGEVVMTPEMTPFLRAAQARGCRVQVGSDMLFEQIPIYLDSFGFPTTTPEHLRRLAADGQFSDA